MKEDWKIITVGELVEYKKGFAFKSSMYQSTGRRIVRLSDTTRFSINISSCQCIDEVVAENYKEYELQKGDIIVSTVGSGPNNPASIVGKVIRVPAEAHGALLNQNAVRLRANGICDSTVLFYLLKNKAFSDYILGRVQGSANQASITLKDIFSYELALPPLPEQKRIAAILSSLDDKIENNRRINKNLEEQAQALFNSWFVDFEPFKDGEFVDSELGMIPKGWRVGSFSDIADVASGKKAEIRHPFYNDDFCYPLIGAADVIGYTNASLYNTPILVTGRVGTHGIVMKYKVPCWPSDNTLVISSSSYEYVYQLMLRFDYKGLNRGSTQPLITQTDIKKTQVVIAPDSIRLRFEEAAKAISSAQEKLTIESRRLAQLRDTLLPKLMNGEIEI